MKNNRRTLAHRLTPNLIATAVMLALSQGALAASGQFTFVTGEVRVVTADNRTVPATRGMEVNPGDLIITGTDGMAQLAMVDSARLSLRSQSQMRIDAYAKTRDGNESAVLSLLRGTMRTFTGLLSPTARQKYTMRTPVATVGIRGSGNLLYHCAAPCSALEPGGTAQPDTSVNHTIEGGHTVQSLGLDIAPLITGPGQTAKVTAGKPPEFIPTPPAILEAARVMSGKSGGDPGSPPEDSRSFGVPDPNAGGAAPQSPTLIGNNGLGFSLTDATGNIVGADPLGLRDIVLAGGFTLSSQASPGGVTLDAVNGALQAFTAYAGLQNGANASISGGTVAQGGVVTVAGTNIVLGRYAGANVSVLGTSTGSPGGVHFAYASAAFPAYLSEVLTGTATYTLAAATSPTDQTGATGNLGSATVNVNFSNRTLNAALAVTLGGGSWNLTANNVPISLNAFYASTSDRLVIVNGTGQSSTTTSSLFGSLEGSFVGAGLPGIILGYAFGDLTGTQARTISGVGALVGPAQNVAAPWRVGLVSDAGGVLSGSPYLRNLLVFNRDGEVNQNSTTGAISGFSAPTRSTSGTFIPYAAHGIGTAITVDSGFDATTGLSWGRWAGGTATVTGGQAIALGNGSMHYVFAGPQSGPVALPLTGTATYDVVGATRPTNGSTVGTFNSATLNANFTARTVDLGVNFTNGGQTWTANAVNVPIYRDLTFGAYAGPALPGVPSPAQLNIGCTPNCGQGATGAVDGFFTGRNGRGAGMMYNVGGNSGAVAFSRRGG